MFRRYTVVAAIFCAAGCSGKNPVSPPIEGDPDEPDGGLGLAPVGDDSADAGASMLADAGITVGGKARVTAGALNLRDGAGTTATILAQMPCGAEVGILGGPSASPAGWWNVEYQTTAGWASGKYLIAEAEFNPQVCGTTTETDAGMSMMPAQDGGVTVDSVFALAKLAVGYSYYWGHGSWRSDHTLLGTCSGTCSACSHTGQYGADCSGFVAKVWQVPSASPIETDEHPYSTYNFYYETTHWAPVPRSSIKPADAFVYRIGDEGHIALYDSGTDPFGNVWLYEARGCSTGIVHDLRTPDSTYITIRRDGF